MKIEDIDNTHFSLGGSLMSPGGASIIAEVKVSGEEAESTEIELDNIPVLPLRGIVPFPGISAPLPIGRESSLKLVKEAQKKNKAIFLVAQKDPDQDSPGFDDLYRFGVIAKVVKVLELPDGSTTAFLLHGSRAVLKSIIKTKPYLRGEVLRSEEDVPPDHDTEMAALLAAAQEIFSKILENYSEEDSREASFALRQYENPLLMLNFICAHSPLTLEDRQELLNYGDMKARVFHLIGKLRQSLELIELRTDIQNRTREELSQQQREHFLHQQIRSIQDELGGSEDEQRVNELREKAEKKEWPEYAAQHFEKELRKLERYSPNMPDYSVQFSYLETLLNLPWNNCSKADIAIPKVERTLNHDHYGLEKVKDRIMEQMAVMKLRGDNKASIICLYGPPGVGKTSLGKSIADALGREYARVSLGGLHDEAEIRGHRRTYIGAMPGRIIAALQKCGTNNPVFVLDEIDKIGRDFKGDPSTALLEVLDPEQNSKFHDNYIDIDYDLSDILFIATANSLNGISKPLLDRMELIQVNGYSLEEKYEIAKRHLVKKQIEATGLEDCNISFTKKGLEYLIEHYTRESGVRQLEKVIGKVLRKIALKYVKDEAFPTQIKPAEVKELLGNEDIMPDLYEGNDIPGVVTGLAWTEVGGDILFIETSLAESKGEKLTLTGNLGDVMKESAQIALQYIRSNCKALDIEPERFNNLAVHIHVPEGAIPKDGPSAGITMATSIASAFTGRKVAPKIAMTGEITLRGKVLPVGGLKEKILAAKRAGILDIVLSSKNRRDIEEIGEPYTNGLTFHYVDTVEEVLKIALLPKETSNTPKQ